MKIKDGKYVKFLLLFFDVELELIVESLGVDIGDREILFLILWNICVLNFIFLLLFFCLFMLVLVFFYVGII